MSAPPDDSHAAAANSEPDRSDPHSAPLSFAQQRLWFLDQLYPQNPAYNLPLGVLLSGPLKRAALQAALQRIVDRHESLRTQFRSEGEQPRQEILGHARLPLLFHDLSSEKLRPDSEPFRELVVEEARRPFDLANDLMFRATLWRFSPDQHFLLINFHHIAADEWSLPIFFREFIELYQAHAAAIPAALPEPPIQYADFALWQRDLVQQGFLQPQLDYWKKQLENLPRLELPADFPRLDQCVRPGARQTRLLDPSMAAPLAQLCRQCQATPFMVFLAAFKVFLCRLTHQEDLPVGSPIAGRTRVETENLIGFFVNTLVLRLNASGNPSFRQCLDRVRSAALDAFSNQDLPFDILVEALHPNRSFGEVPLIQVMFAMESATPEKLTAGNIDLHLSDVHTATAKFDLAFVVRQTASGFQVVAEFDRSLFTPETIQRWLHHFETLLIAACASPEVSIWSLPLLTPAEIKEMTENWNATETAFPSDTSLAALFEQQAQSRPDHPALSFGASQLSYRHLNERANQLAHYLKNHGVTPGSTVAVCLDSSAEFIISLLAVIKTGAAYVPLDTRYPKERLQFIIADARARVLITNSPLRPNFAEICRPSQSAAATLPIPIVSLDDQAIAISQCPLQNPPPFGQGDSVAYMMYTSGSTGRPKGVMVPHRAIARLVLSTNYVSLTPEDRIAQASNVAFDAATFEIWGALLNGATVVGIAKNTALSPSDLARALVSERITTLFLTTALFNQIAQAHPAAFASLRYLLFGGEAVDPKWVSAVLAAGAPKNLLHVYGPTETTTFATFHPVREVSQQAVTIPIGRPLSNTQVFILDRCHQPVPIGAIGELYISGPGLALGYLNRPELTAQRFPAHPFRRNSFERAYKTGDLARFRPDGSIEFVGRADTQVKIRGFRIELGEIESVLASHPSVSQTAVLALDHPNREKTIVAYWVPKSKISSDSTAEFREFLQQQLPDYMVPAIFVALDCLPLTPNGKINRQALPAPDWTRHETERAYRPPQGPVEIQLAQIWQRILGIQQISRFDNFFDLGGHSLLAVRLFSEIQQAFHRTLPLATLFKAPTVAALAACLSESPVPDNEKHSQLLVEIQPGGSNPPIFWIHSLGGDGGGGFFYYRKLSELLGSDQPSYGIRSPAKPITRIEEMARRYIEVLQELQPHGPYHIGGFCFGGVVAFEMARQLSARGLAVGAVVLLESAPPNSRLPFSFWSWRVAAEFVHNLISWAQELPLNNPAQLLSRFNRKRITAQKKLLRKFQRHGGQSSEVELKDLINLAEYPKDYLKYAETHWHALRAYRPQPYSGQLILFRARKQGLSNLDPALGWTPLAQGGVDIHIVSGNHETLLQEPTVRTVAQQLQQSLQSLRAPRA